MLRGDRDVNPVKLKNVLNASEVEPAPDSMVLEMESVPGYIGPEGLPADLKIIWDNSTLYGTEWVIGANEKDHHKTGFVIPAGTARHDVALAREGDPSPAGDGLLHEVKGIEVGHIFKLGYKYTEAFDVSVLDENGKPLRPIMGCYGIGVNRTMAAIIEQNNDEKGIVWPISVAPFEFCLVGITKTAEDEKKVEALYDGLTGAGIDLFYDDRPLRPGVKFSDAELIGFPVRITAGKTFIESGDLEVQIRKTGETEIIKGDIGEIAERLQTIRSDLYAELQPEG